MGTQDEDKFPTRQQAYRIIPLIWFANHSLFHNDNI